MVNTNTTKFEIILDSSSFLRLNTDQLKKITNFFNVYTFQMNIVEINKRNKRKMNEDPFNTWKYITQLQNVIRMVESRPDKKLKIDPQIQDRTYLSPIDMKLATYAIENKESILVTNDKKLRKTVQEYGGHSIDVFSLYHFASELEIGIKYSSVEDMYSNYTPLIDEYEYCIS